MMTIKMVILCITIFSINNCSAQINENSIKEVLYSKDISTKNTIQNNESVRQFYSLTNYEAAWVGSKNNVQASTLLQLIDGSDSIALDKQDYQYDKLFSIVSGHKNLVNKSDSIFFELEMTSAAIHFLSDILYGNKIPALGYNALAYNKFNYNIPLILKKLLDANELHTIIETDLNGFPEIHILIEKLRQFNFTVSNQSSNEVHITSNKIDIKNTAMLKKLYYLGIVEDVNKQMNTHELTERIKEAQHLFNIPTTGLLNDVTIKLLNVPLNKRIAQLKEAINLFRWMSATANNKQIIIVNIPAANLRVYDSSKVILEMKLVVGKPSTPTPTLSSNITDIVLYPYWHVPYSIATKEMLPIIKRNPNYLSLFNFQVLNNYGKVLDPLKINWNELSASYFPYIIRQGTGCDNALGLFKINFNNPFSVYLHDTPIKNAFTKQYRFYSHGCMRMEEPMKLVTLLLNNQLNTIKNFDKKKCFKNKVPSTIVLLEKQPIVVLYNLVSTDNNGQVIFYQDVYSKQSLIK